MGRYSKYVFGARSEENKFTIAPTGLCSSRAPRLKKCDILKSLAPYCDLILCSRTKSRVVVVNNRGGVVSTYLELGARKISLR